MHEWIEVLEAANVPCGPINNMQQVFEDPQVQHRGLKVEIPTPAGVPCPTVASPMRFSETPVEYTRAAADAGPAHARRSCRNCSAWTGRRWMRSRQKASSESR